MNKNQIKEWTESKGPQESQEQSKGYSKQADMNTLLPGNIVVSADQVLCWRVFSR